MNLRLIEADVRTERLAQASKENASLRGELREWQDKQAVLKAQLTSLQVEEADLARTSAVASRVQDEADSRRDEVERLRANRRRLLDEAETLQSPPQRHASAEILFIESE